MPPFHDEARRAAAAAARHSYGRLVALLVRRAGDLAAAEDALGEAFAAALAQWPDSGVPHKPEAWLLAVARRRIIDRDRTRITADLATESLILSREEIDAGADDAVPDRRLALLFACTHPSIETALHSPLMLQVILGFTAAEIGAAFLVPPATMGQRLARAKARLRAADVALELPAIEEWPWRLSAVLESVYACYAKGWAEYEGPRSRELAEEALWLARLLAELLPSEAEAQACLALLLYAESRRQARRDAAGAYVPLDEQDIGLWDKRQIAEAESRLRKATASPGPSGRFQLEAAIQSAHAARRLSGIECWPDILKLYDHLAALVPSPVVTLNRALVLARVEGSETALAAVRDLGAEVRLADYQPYWAALGHLLTENGLASEAVEALTIASGLSEDPAVRHYLQSRIMRLRSAILN